MQLNHGLHLAYSTNVHRGESWAETFGALKQYTLAVRDRVCPHAPYGIGLRLSCRAANELSEPDRLLEFQRWLGQNRCYVFTMNGFPYGQFHGERVKEQVYRPDWSTPERLEYTMLLFDLLSKLLPEGVEGSVSTLPGSFKEFHPSPEQRRLMRANLWHCVEHIARVSEQTGRVLHLGLEPEPLCLLESSAEVLQVWDRLRAEHPHDERLDLASRHQLRHLPFRRGIRGSPGRAGRHRQPRHQDQQNPFKLRAQSPAHAGRARGIEKICRRHLPAPGRRARR